MAITRSQKICVIRAIGGRKLPGAAKISQLETRLKAYSQVDLAQADAGDKTTGLRKDLGAQIETIKKHRRKIQFAADAEWPASDPAHAATRRRFELPLDRPFN